MEKTIRVGRLPVVRNRAIYSKSYRNGRLRHALATMENGKLNFRSFSKRPLHPPLVFPRQSQQDADEASLRQEVVTGITG